MSAITIDPLALFLLGIQIGTLLAIRAMGRPTKTRRRVKKPNQIKPHAQQTRRTKR